MVWIELLEGDAGGEDDGVVVGVEVGEGDLFSGTEGEAEASGFSGGVVGEGDATEDDAGGGEGHDLAVVRSTVEAVGVELGFGPEEAGEAGFGDVILDGGVGEDGVAELGFVGHGE